MYETRPCCKGGCVRIIEMRRGLSLIFSNKARSSPVLLVFPSYPCLDLKKQTNCSIPQISQRLTVQYNVVLPLQWLHIEMQRLVAPPNYAIFFYFFLPSFYCLSCWNMYCPWQKYYHLHLFGCFGIRAVYFENTTAPLFFWPSNLTVLTAPGRKRVWIWAVLIQRG